MADNLSKSMEDMQKIMNGALCDLNERTIALINYKGFYETIKGACELLNDNTIDAVRFAVYVNEQVNMFVRLEREYDIKWRYE